MKLNNKIRFAAVGVVTLGLVAGASMVASATTQTNGSYSAMYVADTNGAVVSDPAVVWHWSSDITAAGSSADFAIPLACPAESTGTYTFIAPVGSENVVNSWKAYALTAFETGTTGVAYADVKPASQINGAADAVKSAGGTYSLGVACTTNNGVTVVRSFFRTIHVTAATGDYTIDAVDAGVVVEPPVGPPVAGPQSGNVALAPATAPVVNGVLALTVPTNAAATFSAPSLVANKSTSVGTLGAITVNDQRVVTREGWDLTANVLDFNTVTPATATGNNIISKAQLGFVPSVTVGAATTAVGGTATAGQVAGSASYPAAFASAAANKTVGDTALNAALTFVAPQEKVVGTYTSTMTLTVVTK